MALELQILTASETMAEGTVDEIVVPSASGEVTVLPDHTHYAAILGQGRLACRKGEKTDEFRITGGFICVEGNKVVVLVDSFLADLNMRPV